VQKQYPGKRAAFVQNAHIKSFANWVFGEVNTCILIIIVCLLMSLHLKALIYIIITKFRLIDREISPMKV
jgi:hypothetical protein